MNQLQAHEIATLENQALGIIRDTRLVLDEAKSAAQNLSEVIANKKKPVIFNGEQYLEFEDWQTAGQFYGYTVRTGESTPVEIEGVKGAKARAELFNRDGQIVGGAESYCMRDEANWRGKPWFQLASMAQTRAGSKALRNRLAWFVVLAGFKSTPAEEVESHHAPVAPPARKETREPVPEPVGGVVEDILNMLIELNNGSQVQVEEHLKVLTAWHDKATGEEKWLKISDLENVFKKKPDWIQGLHKKVLALYA